jgi:hypothetical protein
MTVSQFFLIVLAIALAQFLRAVLIMAVAEIRDRVVYGDGRYRKTMSDYLSGILGLW